jgi:hypothetical protein
MKLKMNDKVCVLKTGRLYEFDMAVVALKKQGIPFYNETESSSGLRLAMPMQPSVDPGTFYSILVPSRFVETAKQTIEELPFEVTTNPGVWDFLPDKHKKLKKYWKVYSWICVIILLFSLVQALVEIVQTIASAL